MAANIEKAVKAGKMSKEDAKFKLVQLRKWIWGEKGKDPRVSKYEAVEAQVRKAVREGKMTREEGAKKLAEVKKHIWKQTEADKKKCDKRPEPKTDKKPDPRVAKYKAIVAKITEAMRAGKLTREEGIKKITAVRKEMFGKKK